jgi:hypothetical protein
MSSYSILLVWVKKHLVELFLFLSAMYFLGHVIVWFIR